MAAGWTWQGRAGPDPAGDGPSAYDAGADGAPVVTFAAAEAPVRRRTAPFVVARRIVRALATGADPGGIATLPAHARTALALATSEDATVADVLDLLAEDPMLAGAVLGTARSARYATAGVAPRTLRDAALRLGLDGMRPVLLEAVAKGYVFRGPCRAAAAAVFDHSVRVAHACHALARLGPKPACGAPWLAEDVRREAFACGLFHDVGRIHVLAVLDRAGGGAPEDPRRVAEIAHADAGALLVARWGLSPVVVEAVERHHGMLPDVAEGTCLWHAGHLVALAERALAAAAREGADRLADDPAAWPDPWPALVSEAGDRIRLARVLATLRE